MQFTPVLRKATEFGIGLTAITTLILAGCGGSGSGGNNDANSTPTAAVTIQVTPGKGVMYGASIVIRNASDVQVGTGTTSTTTGAASVTLATGATGPFVVSVDCPATCQYFDEKTMTLVYGSATTPSLLAVLPGTGSTDVGVTAATHAAAQYALANGGAAALTPTSVLAVNDAVGTLLGLPAGSSILTPPTLITNGTTLAAAQAGTTAADRVALISAAMSVAASGVSAIQAINDYGNAWQQAARVPASGVILPPTLDAASMVAVAPTVPGTTITNVASSVAAATTAAASAVADVSAYLAEVVQPGNSTIWWMSHSTINGAVMTSYELTASSMQGTQTGTDTYSVTATKYKSVNGGAWQAVANDYSGYQLIAAGWVVSPNGGTLVNNLDGTLTLTPTGRASQVEKVIRTNLSGWPISCYSPATGTSTTANCATPSTYPLGSYVTTSTYTSAVDSYSINTSSFDTVTDMTGVQLSALPAPGASFCVLQGPGGAMVFKPIVPAPPAGADNYNAFGAMSCAAADIAAATGAATVPQGTVLLSTKSTGIAGVSVGLSTAALASPVAWLNDNIIAVVNGLVYPGWRTPAGPRSDINDWNKTAVNAELAAHGYPTLP